MVHVYNYKTMYISIQVTLRKETAAVISSKLYFLKSGRVRRMQTVLVGRAEIIL